MSAKKLKKYGDINVPAVSLHPPDKDGYLTKQGGSFKSWKKRYFILKDRTLFYYKTPKDAVFTGKLELEPTSLVQEEQGKKKPNLFSISTAKRIYFMYADKPEEVKPWIEALQRGIGKAKPLGSSPTTSNHNNATPKEPTEPKAPVHHSNGSSKSPRDKLSVAKQQIHFLKDEESKVLEFWQIWSESIPMRNELTTIGMSIDFHVATSADMQKITWKTSGPQNIFIQKMVDFFWNVGAPETEIDRLNDVGALINPLRIGSWIDMSAKGGMDGGWYFPVEISLRMAIEAADPGDALTKFKEWCEGRGITTAYSVGRDMGAAPPRQTEIRIRLPGATPEAQLNLGIEAFVAFDFPPIPEDYVKVLRRCSPSDSCNLSVITSAEGFVRIGLLVPKPSTDNVLSLLELADGNRSEIANFEASLQCSGPSYVEFQHLQKGFGYGVYKEGFDIVFHYDVGEEVSE